ncbi:hypothetical protein MNQ98_12050 [Paenibacillus sp. N3/727]|uniref:hypothetical protein n=1 Tax=Paenibacillus sp. N3/727 TaxID=2925845 RepID=UPI001F53C1DD|nr:hypothetical protein [Paenibacillus sp. N3/727]UNK20693.1 hypothetical protein MNQ98_12050 [Paenibacillus sp. N3/727]
MVKLKWFLISLVLILFSFLIIQAYEKEIFNLRQVSTKTYDSNNVEIQRDKYNLRNFMWSGIFPIYGGFIPDPHYLYSEPVDVTEYLSSVFHNNNVRYQLIDVNPFFENRTSENILAMEINGSSFEYKLEFPQNSTQNILQHNEPKSVFLYNEDTLYFVLQYDWEGKFLIYEIGYPFTENKNLNYHLIDIDESYVPAFLNFSLSQDQIDQLLKQTYSDFYQFYTQYLNKDYTSNQLLLNEDENISLTAYYGAILNINRYKMKDITDEEFSLKIHNQYEFITSIQNVKIASSLGTEKIVIKLLHNNYYDLLSLGDSFETSDFAIRNETKYILIDYDYIDRLLSYIDLYRKLRDDKTKSNVYFKDKSPVLVEVITQFNSESTIDRWGLSALIFPPNLSPQLDRNFSNRTEYALPNDVLDKGYLFIMDFNDGYSIKLSYNEVQKLEDFLKSIKFSSQKK